MRLQTTCMLKHTYATQKSNQEPYLPKEPLITREFRLRITNNQASTRLIVLSIRFPGYTDSHEIQKLHFGNQIMKLGHHWLHSSRIHF